MSELSCGHTVPQREARALGDPEVLQKPLAQRVSLDLEALGEKRIIPDLARQARGAAFGVIDVALDLAGCD